MGNGNYFRIDCAHQVNSIRGHIQYVNFVVGDLFNVEIDVKRFVTNEGFLVEEGDFLRLVAVLNDAVVLDVEGVLFVGGLGVQVSRFLPFM